MYLHVTARAPPKGPPLPTSAEFADLYYLIDRPWLNVSASVWCIWADRLLGCLCSSVTFTAIPPVTAGISELIIYVIHHWPVLL